MSVDALKNKAFWNEMHPQFHIDDGAFIKSFPPFGIDDDFKKYLSHQMVVEGYVQIDIPLKSWGLSIPALGEGVSKLVQHNLMPVFAYVYDEFWLAFFRLHHVISNILGPFALLPDFWAWHVDPKKAESGWNPHRDKGRNALFPDGKPKSMTIWIAITQATPLNGCMYIVPADRDPTYNTPDEKKLIFKPNDIRALPGEAGTVFCWNQAVHHWGGHASPRAQTPRISLAMEFQRTDVPAFREPLLKSTQLPSFEARLLLISRQILQYQHMYPISPELKVLATALGRG